MTDQELDGFLAQCCQQLEQRQLYLVEEFGLGRCDRFDLNLQEGLITGYDSIGAYFRAEVVPIGSYSRGDRQWRWAWSRPEIPSLLQQTAARLQTLAEKTGLQLFRAESFESDEALVWELTAMACRSLNAAGCYKAESGDRYLMVALTSIHP